MQSFFCFLLASEGYYGIAFGGEAAGYNTCDKRKHYAYCDEDDTAEHGERRNARDARKSFDYKAYRYI